MAIAVTGAAGFIGSCLVSFLNKKGITDIIVVDDLSDSNKLNRINTLTSSKQLDRNNFIASLPQLDLEFIFHIGARTDTTEMDVSIFDKLNLDYSKDLWNACTQNQIALLYASSAATYGDGELGFVDDASIIPDLKPLNPYGQSKQDFDVWVLNQENHPPFWCGLKFFNVFGPNENHKSRMASVVFHAFNQIKTNGSLNLFQSHNPEYKDGEQMRDFIYIKDLLELMWFWYQNQQHSGIYNAGTGKAESFLSLANAIFTSMELDAQINFIPTPVDIRDKYQYFTEADMKKTKGMGFDHKFMTLAESVKDYVQNYLMLDQRY